MKAGGTLYEQAVSITSGETTLPLRRVVLKLNKPARTGEHELGLFTNLLQATVEGSLIADIYRTHWESVAETEKGAA